MAIALFDVLMIVIGILIWALIPKATEVGRAMFWAGFIGLAIAYSTHMVHVG